MFEDREIDEEVTRSQVEAPETKTGCLPLLLVVLGYVILYSIELSEEEKLNIALILAPILLLIFLTMYAPQKKMVGRATAFYIRILNLLFGIIRVICWIGVIVASLVYVYVKGIPIPSLSKNDTFELFLYPNKSDLTEFRNGGAFETAQAARVRARTFLARNPQGDYEIGKNCESRPYSTLKVCQETFR